MTEKGKVRGPVQNPDPSLPLPLICRLLPRATSGVLLVKSAIGFTHWDLASIHGTGATRVTRVSRFQRFPPCRRSADLLARIEAAL